MKNSINTLIIFALIIGTLGTAAVASSCPTVMSLGDEIKWKLKSGSAIFAGAVMSVTEGGSRKQISFRVIEFWKGELDSKITVSTYHNPAASGYDFKVGKRYLVFAEFWENGHHTGECSDNRELEKAEAELKILGKGKTPKSPRVKK